MHIAVASDAWRTVAQGEPTPVFSCCVPAGLREHGRARLCAAAAARNRTSGVRDRCPRRTTGPIACNPRSRIGKLRHPRRSVRWATFLRQGAVLRGGAGIVPVRGSLGWRHDQPCQPEQVPVWVREPWGVHRSGWALRRTVHHPLCRGDRDWRHLRNRVCACSLVRITRRATESRCGRNGQHRVRARNQSDGGSRRCACCADRRDGSATRRRTAARRSDGAERCTHAERAARSGDG